MIRRQYRWRSVLLRISVLAAAAHRLRPSRRRPAPGRSEASPASAFLRPLGLLVLVNLMGCIGDRKRLPEADPDRPATSVSGIVSDGNAAVPQPKNVTGVDSYRGFQALAKKRARQLLGGFPQRPERAPVEPGSNVLSNQSAAERSQGPSSAGGTDPYDGIQEFAEERADQIQAAFFKGRYNRSRARLPENVERWRSEPDIANPGPDLANFPNSAFTLPAGRAYIEFSPLTFYGSAVGQPVQYNAEYLLRYGVTDDIEFRLFGNGVSWTGGARSTWGFAPIAFDTKIQLWTEKQQYFLPAAGLEVYLQTQWLGSAAFNAGTQPSFTFNFDQSLPIEIDFEYNLGATRIQAIDGTNVWEFSFQWGLQRDLFDKDFAVFVHGFYNAMSLPRLPTVSVPAALVDNVTQTAVGAGFVWTVDQRFAVYGQVSGGTTRFTPSTISMLGFAAAF
jgi:hypothetical protein